eukprot:5468461-Amphidinium_carterae.1
MRELQKFGFVTDYRSQLKALRAYPTEQRLRQKQMKEQGHEVKPKKKIVEQWKDDMGDTLTGLGISEQDLHAFVDWHDEDNSESSTEDEEEHDAQFNHFWTAGLECSSTQQPLQLPAHRTIA